MIVIIDDRRPTGIGESVSGAKAFYINSTLIDDWYRVETHPNFQRLGPQDKDAVRENFPRSLLIYHNINAAGFP